MNLLLDPATRELLFTSSMSLALLASAALTIAALPWTDGEIAAVDQTARQLVKAPARRLATISRQAFVRA